MAVVGSWTVRSVREHCLLFSSPQSQTQFSYSGPRAQAEEKTLAHPRPPQHPSAAVARERQRSFGSINHPEQQRHPSEVGDDAEAEPVQGEEQEEVRPSQPPRQGSPYTQRYALRRWLWLRLIDRILFCYAFACLLD
jgi:hypothetical protein